MRQPVSTAECDHILARSRVNNSTACITGVLVVGGNRFLQLLEGDEEAVEARFEAIRADPRHFAVVMLDKRRTSERQCPDWSMGYVHAGSHIRGETLSDVVNALVEPIEDPYLRAQFTGFAALQDRAA